MNGPIPTDRDSTTPSWLSTVTGCEIRSTEWIGIDFGLSGHGRRVIGRNPQGEEVDVVVELTTDANAAREIPFYRPTTTCSGRRANPSSSTGKAP